LSVRTPGVWEIRQETPFLPNEPGKADQKIDFSWGHSALHSFYHSPTESFMVARGWGAAICSILNLAPTGTICNGAYRVGAT